MVNLQVYKKAKMKLTESKGSRREILWNKLLCLAPRAINSVLEIDPWS